MKSNSLIKEKIKTIMELVKVFREVYKPTFNPSTGEYEDVSPFACHSRNNMNYICLCNHKEFNTLTKFKQHIQLKSHVKFLDNYELHNEETIEANANSNDYQVKYELSQRKLSLLENNYYQLENNYYHYKLLTFILKYKMLKMDQFEDCE